jgi:hypothetical protein
MPSASKTCSATTASNVTRPQPSGNSLNLALGQPDLVGKARCGRFFAARESAR